MTGRYFESVDPSPEDLVRASELPLTACPRRYCWWWKTLSFDWDTPVLDGCEYSRVPKPAHWLETDKPCCRINPGIGADLISIDQYEPREPHLESDGFHRYRFVDREARSDRNWSDDSIDTGTSGEKPAS